MITLRTKGIPYQLDRLVVGRVTRNVANTGVNAVLIMEDDQKIQQGFAGVLTTNSYAADSLTPCVYGIAALDHLQEGDIVYLGEDGNVKTLYRVNSFHNMILATERCNSNCLMCSQPPKDRDDVPRLFEIYRQAIPLIPKDCFELTISGGEPTLMGNLLFQLLELIKEELPNTEIHILTNGRIFAWPAWAERLAAVSNPRIMLGIPVYSDYYQQHDHIVQARNAFNQTILGLHNLARYGIRTEIRVVLHALSVPRLSKLSRFIYKNLPFAEHVTFMGLEYTGYTPHNIDQLWIDPYDYGNELEESVHFLATQGMHVSVYNAQLCILPVSLWPFARKSISDWKNDYMECCQHCDMLNDCGGLFTWNLKKCSAHIQPLKLSKNENLNEQVH
jgi:His-Xaa-Ser system radical SAM maturase HxsC